MSTTITVSLKDVLDKIKNNEPQRKPQNFMAYRRPLSETLGYPQQIILSELLYFCPGKMCSV